MPVESVLRPPVVAGVASALPPAVPQTAVRDFAASLFPSVAEPRYLAMFDNAAIDRRHLVDPIERYGELRPFGEREQEANRHGVALGAAAARAALDRADVRAGDVDALVFVSTTSLRAPNLDVDLVPALGLRADVRRVPLFGFASLGGAAGLALAADLVRAGHGTVLLVAVEVNSLMFVPDEPSPQSLVTLALFSDGAAAVVVRAGAPDEASAPRLVGRHTTLVPDSLRVMGFDATDHGLRWRLAPDVPEVALANTRVSAEAAVASVGWSLGELGHVLLHPGGAKVLDACQEVLGLDDGALISSRRTLAEHGNVSSATLLLVLEDFLATGPRPGRGLATAMGPGFAYEHVLFEL